VAAHKYNTVDNFIRYFSSFQYQYLYCMGLVVSQSKLLVSLLFS
jgi:hypothetical protein